MGETLVDIARRCAAALDDAEDPRVIAHIVGIRQRAAEGLEDLRSARRAQAHDLLHSRRLTQSLRELARRFQAQTRILTELRAPSREPKLPYEVSWALYEVAAETLEALERRSRATGIVMIVHADGDQVSMSIRDDGVGLLARQGSGWPASPHTALRAMRRAMSSVGGAVSVTSTQPRGLLVRAVVPLRVA